MGPKKKAAKAAAAPAKAAAAPAGGAAGPGVGGTETSTAATFTPAEAKKLAKLLKASDRGKRLDAIGVVSENHRYIASGGCLLPLLESVVAKKKMEDVVLAASQVIVDYLVGRDPGGDPTVVTDSAMAALQEAKKKPAKYKLAEVLTNLVLNPDQQNSWNAVRSLRSIAAAVHSLPAGSSQHASLGAMLLKPGKPVERLCGYLVAQEAQQSTPVETPEAKKGAAAEGRDPVVPWPVVRLQVMDTIGVMCGVSDEAVQTVVSTGTVRCVLGVLRSITESEAPDMALLTSTLVILFAVAKAGGGGIAPEVGIAEGDIASGSSPGVAMAATAGVGASSGGEMPSELAALAEGGAWGAVYDALKGPCMARATELQQASATAGGAKKGAADAAAAVSADLTGCLDNMARCAEVLRVMAMTGAGLEEEGALEAGVAAMSSILGMEGLPREQAAVANLMTGMVKAMGSIACLSESNRIKVCSAGAAAKVLALMAPPDPSASGVGGSSSPPDTPHGRLTRKTAEKCLHHLVVSRVTWLADDRALCDTSAPPADTPESSQDIPPPSGNAAGAGAGEGGDNEKFGTAETASRPRRSGSFAAAAAPNDPPPALGPAYLSVDAVLAAATAGSIDVRCRAIRLLSRLMSSPRCASALGVSAVPALGRLIEWWLQPKNGPEAQRTPRPSEPAASEGGGGKSAAGAAAAGGGKKGAGGKAGAKEAAAAAAATAAAEAASKNEQAAKDEVAAAAAARAAAKELEESDSTRVLRDEALAYALTVMLKLAEAGREQRAAIGENATVELLAGVLKSLPCTPEEFYANGGEHLGSMTVCAAVAAGTARGTKSPTIPAAAAVDEPAVVTADNGGGNIGTHHAPSHAADDSLLAAPKPDTTLDLSLAHRRPSSGGNPRKLCCWRGAKSRDPEVPLFSPLDWGWDFEVGVSQVPVQPGLVLRAAALRVLLAVVDGYDPAVEATAAAEAAASAPAAGSKGGAGAAAAAAAETSAKAAALSGGSGARTVLKHVLPVCLDLLSVDVRHAGRDDDGVEGENRGGGSCSSRNHGESGTEADRKTASQPKEQQQQQQQQGQDADNAGGQSFNSSLSADFLSGRPVSPSEELVHKEIRVACLRLLGSLLRLGGTAREGFLSTSATHRDGGFTHIKELCGSPREEKEETAPPARKTTGAAAAEKNNAGGENAGGWVRPESFRSWNLSAGEGCEPASLRDSLPYVRMISMFMLPLRNPDAPITDIVAALVALKRLCRENEHETGGTQPEPLPQSAENDESVPPLPSSREGTAGVLVDTIAGVAVSMGALVPLMSIWGCALAAAGSAADLAPEETGMVNECQALIDYLIRRGHAREEFWSSLPSLGQIAETKAAAAEAAAPKKAPRKSKGSAVKAGKGGGGDGGKGSRSSVTGLEVEDEEKPDAAPKPPEPPAGRPDPNLGPNRASWSKLLDSRMDEQRTQTCGTTALLMATVTGLETAVGNLLLAGADPNVRGKDGRSPLMCALAQGMDEAAHGLVAAGADVDAVNHLGDNVLKCAFLCPSRQAMRDVMRKGPEAAGAEAVPMAPSSGWAGPLSSASSSRRGSTAPSIDGWSGRVGRRRSNSRSVSRSRSRSRSRSGSLTRDRRRSSLGRSVSFGEGAFGFDTAGGAASSGGSGGGRRRVSRMASLSALDSARAALHDLAPRESARPLKTPRGTTIVRGDARMVPYILGCGADPNVSSASGDFPLHWAVSGTELTVKIMNQRVKIVAGGTDGGDGVVRGEGHGKTTRADVGEDSSSNGSNANRPAAAAAGATVAGAAATEQGAAEHEQDVALLKVLVGAGSALDACNPDGMTALHAAVLAGRGTLAGTLLDAGASPNYSDSLGCLPLHYACLRAVAGYADLANRLLALGMGRPLDKGVHRDLRKGKTRREKLILDVADIMHKGLREATEPSSITQHRATRSELLNFVSAEGLTPIHYVCDGRIVGRHAAAAVLALWEERAPPATAAPGTTILNGGGPDSGGGEGRVTVEDGSIDRVKTLRWLLSESEVDPTVRLPRGATTLHLASRTPGSQGADLVRVLTHAGGAGAWESARLLLSAGARVRPEGSFPPCLHVACLAGAPASLVKALLDGDSQASSTTILPAGAEPYTASPLLLAAASGNADLVEMLLSTAGGIGSIVEDHTAMLVGTGGDDGVPRTASAEGSESIWTMEHSPSDGRNPLHAAAAEGHMLAALVLVDADADATRDGSAPRSWLNTPDIEGNTPLDVAVYGGHWECAERLAVAERFDIRLAVERGPSSSLIVVERANMAIVDEGSGDPQTLRALRESNKLVMALLKRLHDTAGETVAAAAAATTTTATAPTCEQTDGEAAVTDDAIDDTAAGASPPSSDRGQPEDEAQTPAIPAHDGAGAAAQPLPSPRPTSFPVVHHLHPCFAEGVLYSNAKGIFVPETPERTRRRRSSRQQEEGDAHDRAAVVIQSRARQAGAKRAVAERRADIMAADNRRRASSSSGGVGRRRSWSEATDQEKAAVIIQAQARQARARSEAALRREHQQRRRSSKRGGEVGAVVVTRVQPQQQQ
ncbi:conserved unknown protein [Ectocarpus siliculosus]|uniref:Uncharacterized protein n=1 Tax=Ectocarpus siliculosus TaxID=2880 RepID=D7FH05_ECTSI|nr:conserved unknown protein [Ectocarpus siliculosus]|eukprot:CBJ28383.1 conserved unknown protein [Ectocarpus siliculosus]